MFNKVKRAVIPAAGFGTRFLPITKAMPKEMLPIVDKPTIQYIVEEALDSGIEEILIISGHGKRAIEDYFDSAPYLEKNLEKSGKLDYLKMVRDTADIRVHYIRQREVKGLGDAVLTAKSFVAGEPFAVLLGDDVIYNPEKPALRQLMDVYEEYGRTIIGCQKVAKEDVSGYGIIDGMKVENSNVIRVHNMIEKPSAEKAPSNIAVLGRYIITPKIFEILEKTEAGSNNEIHLTDALRELANKEAVFAYEFEGKMYDLGSKLGFLKAQVEYALRRNELSSDFKEYIKEIISVDL